MSSLPPEFKLERYFDKYEFTTKYLLCCSDAEPIEMSFLLQMADDQCKNLWENLKLSYTEAQGSSDLRQEVSKLHSVTPNNVLVVAPQEGIYIAMKCLVHYLISEKGCKTLHAISTFPAYQSLYENLKLEGLNMSYWNVRESSSGWTFSLDELKSLITDETKILVVNFPHNPTGFVPTHEQWLELMEICKQRDIFLFSDEMYRLSNNDGSLPLPSASACYDNSITLFGVSKTFALPGLRIGWLVTKNEKVMKAMRSFKDYLSICPPAPSEILALIALRNKEKVLDYTLNILKANLKHLDGFFAKHKDIFVWYKPKACTTGFVKLKGNLLNIGSGGASGFCDELVKKKQVLLLPSTMYDHSNQFVRLSFGRKDLKECIEKLEEFLSEMK